MKQFKITILMIATSMLLCACPNKEDGHRYITFVNKSERDISCQDFWSGHITDADTLFQCRIGAVGIPTDSLCNFPSLNHSGWETDFRAIPYMQFLVMDRDVYWQYHSEPCDSIRKYVPVLHCYRLTLEDLQRMNWTVVYPPE
jgi:hypothetical protein